jgi:hypothetical protein
MYARTVQVVYAAADVFATLADAVAPIVMTGTKASANSRFLNLRTSTLSYSQLGGTALRDLPCQGR